MVEVWGNTSFFHRKIASHTARNRILIFSDEEGGNNENDYEKVKEISANYYRKHFSKEGGLSKERAKKIRQVL